MELMAGFTQTEPEPPSQAIGGFRRVPRMLPAGLRHAVAAGETVALCGARVVIENGPWQGDRRGPGFRDCKSCAELV